MSKHPPLKDLSEYASESLDEVRRAEIFEHLKACPACADKVEASQRLDLILSATLKVLDGRSVPGDCLPPIMLADYFDDSLSTERRASAEQHLAGCHECRANLIAIQKTLEKQRSGEFAGLEERIRQRSLDLVEPEGGTQRPKCPSCGGKVGNGASECPACGLRPRPEAVALICMSCRNAIPVGSRFCPLCGAAIAPPKKSLAFLFARRQSFSELLRAHVWLILSLAAMAASFFFRRYFMQCIAISAIFGAKWILDQAQFRIYSEILKSLKKSSEPEKQARPRKRKTR